MIELILVAAIAVMHIRSNKRNKNIVERLESKLEFKESKIIRLERNIAVLDRLFLENQKRLREYESEKAAYKNLAKTIINID